MPAAVAGASPSPTIVILMTGENKTSSSVLDKLTSLAQPFPAKDTQADDWLAQKQTVRVWVTNPTYR